MRPHARPDPLALTAHRSSPLVQPLVELESRRAHFVLDTPLVSGRSWVASAGLSRSGLRVRLRLRSREPRVPHCAQTVRVVNLGLFSGASPCGIENNLFTFHAGPRLSAEGRLAISKGAGFMWE